MKQSVKNDLQLKKNKLKLQLSDIVDLWTSQYLDIKDVESVCLALGPYRNLTTLTASVLFLHPDCQVLNHAGSRIFNNKKINFLSNFNKRKFNRFIQFAIKISGKGQRGGLGGSITYSHAFDSKYETKEKYIKTGLKLTKKKIKCLFWKESHSTSNLIHKQQVDLANIFEKDDRLRFLLPIRNPLDCATSNLKTGHVINFEGLNKNSSSFEVVQAVLDEIFWFAELKEKFPNRFFYYFENKISRNMLVNLAKFLQLNQNEAWIENALSIMKINSGYDHDSELLQFYRDYISSKDGRFPELSKDLLSFIDKTDSKNITLIHTPKCGGTYLNQEYNTKENKHIKSVGHAHFLTLEIPPKTAIVGLIREPMDWYTSYYYFSKKSLSEAPQSIGNFPIQHPISVFTKNQNESFEQMILNMEKSEFLENILATGMVANVYAREINDLFTFMKRTGSGFWTWTMMYHFSKKDTSDMRTKEEVLLEAKAIADRVSFIHQENIDADIEKHLNIPQKKGEHINASPRPSNHEANQKMKLTINKLDGEVAYILGGYKSP